MCFYVLISLCYMSGNKFLLQLILLAGIVLFFDTSTKKVDVLETDSLI